MEKHVSRNHKTEMGKSRNNFLFSASYFRSFIIVVLYISTAHEQQEGETTIVKTQKYDDENVKERC